MTATQSLAELRAQRFLRLEVELEPVGSPTFQPATFANTGHSFYRDRDGQLSVVVESVASMANMLEATVWDDVTLTPTEPIAPLPWVDVQDGDATQYTSSRTAAHRLFAHSMVNGAIADTGESFKGLLEDRLGAEPRPPVAHALASVVWDLDPLTILHGVWLAGIWHGRARLTRALSARIDAHDVQSQDVQVGGQKTGDSVAEIGAKQPREKEGEAVYGEIPHHTSEVSASSIVGRIVLDVGLLRSYGLGEAREQALTAVGALQIRELIDAWPRRRSRCTLLPVDASSAVREPEGWQLPEAADMRAACRELCEAATEGSAAANPTVVKRKQSKS